MKFGETVKSLRLSRCMTQKDLAAAVGVSTVTVQHWENCTKSPSMNAIIELSRSLRVSTDTLLGVDVRHAVPSSAISRAEASLLDDFRALDQHGQQMVKTVCRLEKARMEESSAEIINIENARRESFIPHYTTPSAAGTSTPLDGSDFEMLLVTDDIPKNADAAVNIQGNSMAPYIQDGDMVFVRKTSELNVGDVGIFCVDGAMYCKQYYPMPDGSLQLVSANEALRHTNVTIAVDSGQTVQVYGKVILDRQPELPSYLFK